MASYSKAVAYLSLFLFVTVSIHEVGHLVVARRLISPEATVHFFPEFPFGRALGFVAIPESVTYPVWKGFLTALIGPLLATILMSVIWLNTDNRIMALISSFFAINQLVYTLVEPLVFIKRLPNYMLSAPLIVAGIWTVSYAYYIGKYSEEWT